MGRDAASRGWLVARQGPRKGRPWQESLCPEMAPPREPERGPRGRQQKGGNFGQRISCEQGTVQQLVMVLSENPSFTMSLLNLLEYHNLQPKDVRQMVAYNGHLFQLQNDEVVLAPRLKLCDAHSSDSGCQDRKGCDSLHMCNKYVLGWCSEKEGCVLGHRWHTDHNLAILRRLSMEYVRYRVLHELLRRSHRRGQHGSRQQAGPLDVCKEYNNAGCNQPKCPSLHVCLSFVVGLTICTQDNCDLNHNLLNPACCHLLKLHQLPMNEAPRDVAMAILLANPGLKDRAKSHPIKAAARGQERKGNKAKKLQQEGNRKKQIPTKKGKKVSSSSSTESETESESDDDDSDDKGKKSHKVKSSHSSKAKSRKTSKQDSSKIIQTRARDETLKVNSYQNKTKKTVLRREQNRTLHLSQRHRRTLWAHYLQGDVADPRICYYSVETICRDEATGCPKLHCTTHFHWQVKEQDGRWINLPPKESLRIERAFCNPANDNVALSRLEPEKLDPSTTGLLLLLGRDIWQADFLSSKLTNSTKSKTLQLRRLCTEIIAGLALKASTYHWYFLDINKKWVKYGNMDTTSRQELVSSITSTDIENHYEKTPQQPLHFKNSRFSYILNFDSMTQTNQSTGVIR
ncbi:uncharacterized protein LOC123516712, partial [Portunus trituberculatus]|uniref:uncharacterized protein LOC123516712 n=1 Tax=Portunus trituberculatus TaxID=210409 RepID=UPI001E1CDFC7